MFKGCVNLGYINLNNFSEVQLLNNSNYYKEMFNDVPENVVVCIDPKKTINKIFRQIAAKTCSKIDCTDNSEKRQIEIIYKNYTCIDNDNNNNNNNNNQELVKILKICSTTSITNNELCSKCNSNFSPKENDPLNKENSINCYKGINGYYLYSNDLLYKKCYNSCRTCEIKGNNIIHNCLQCHENFFIEINVNNYTNCYNIYNFYHFYDNENKLHCTFSCPDDYPILMQRKNECIAFNEMKNLIQNISENINNSEGEKEIQYYNEIMEIIETVFISAGYNRTNINDGKDEIITIGKMTVILTTTKNQKKNKNNNETTIIMDECVNSLIDYYHLSKNETIYMKKTIVIQEGMRIPKIEYDVYNMVSENKLKKLNISICNKSKIYLLTPCSESENLDILNSSSDYYKDVCYITTSERGTDISLEDRKMEFINKTLCQDYCEFSGYNNETKKVNCSCDVKESSSFFSDIKIDTKKLYTNFVNIKNIANLKMLRCYKNLFSKNGILKNIGSYIILLIMILFIISIFIFYIKQVIIIKKKINDLIYALNNINFVGENKKDIIPYNNKYKKRNKKNKNNNTKKKKNIIEIEERQNKNKSYCINSYNKNNKKNKEENKKQNNSELNNMNSFISNRDNIINRRNKGRNKKNNKITNNTSTNKKEQKKKEKVKKILKYKYDEINLLTYDLSIQYDKRTYCKYYISLLKTKHDFVSSFCGSDDYNVKIIKIDLFVMGFAIFYTVNALFYNDDVMHKIYEDRGGFDFIYQLPKDIYSSLISIILNKILNLLALSNDVIVNFKQSKNKKDSNKRGKNLKKKLRIKFILFFIISFIFLLFFWYYLSLFGAIYSHTQYHLLKDTLISFGLGLIYPFAIYLLPGLFRIPSLSARKNNKKCLYKFSRFLQMF